MTRDPLNQPRWHDRPSARSLLLTVLGEYAYPAGRPVFTRTFVAALALLGTSAQATRQALARSATAGWLQPERIGRETRWRLSSETQRVLAAGATRIYGFGQSKVPWDGEWILLHVRVPDSRRELRSKLRARLAWAGFGAAGSGLWISPDPSRELEAAEALNNLGLADCVASLRGRPGSLGGLDQLARSAWDVAAIAGRYKAFLAAHEMQRPRAADQVFRASTTLVHRWRAFPFLDPGLPASLLPKPWIGDRAAHRFRELHERWSERATKSWRELEQRTASPGQRNS